MNAASDPFRVDVAIEAEGIQNAEPTESVAGAAFADERPLRRSAGWFDWRLNGGLSRLLQEQRFDGAFGETLLMSTHGRLPHRRLFLFGLGGIASYDPRAAAQAVQYAAATLAAAGVTDVVLDLEDWFRGQLPLQTGLALLVDGLAAGAVRVRAECAPSRLRVRLVCDAPREEELRRLLVRPVTRPGRGTLVALQA